jgi:hypothetical protein
MKTIILTLFICYICAQSLVSTHYWDCNGGGCDSTILQPWDQNKYVSPSGYAPQDPNNFGGPSSYGEKLWMVGAASDTLSQALGANEPGCGYDTHSPYGKLILFKIGCGKCILISNPNSGKIFF